MDTVAYTYDIARFIYIFSLRTLRREQGNIWEPEITTTQNPNLIRRNKAGLMCPSMYYAAYLIMCTGRHRAQHKNVSNKIVFTR